VARSLERRDGIPVLDGLALWERYNRSALAALRGLPVTVVEYDSVVADPASFAEDATAWLDGLEGFPPSPIPPDEAAAATLVRRDLRHESSTAHDGPLLPEQRRLVDLLSGLDGHHRTLATEPGPESSQSTLLLEHRRQAARQRRLLEAFARQREGSRIRHFEDRRRKCEVDEALAITRAQLAGAQEALADLRASTSWRVTRPLRSATAHLEQLSRRPHSDGQPRPGGAP